MANDDKFKYLEDEDKNNLNHNMMEFGYFKKLKNRKKNSRTFMKNPAIYFQNFHKVDEKRNIGNKFFRIFAKFF